MEQIFKGRSDVWSFVSGFLLILIGIIAGGSFGVILSEILKPDFFGSEFSKHFTFVTQMFSFVVGAVAVLFVVKKVHHLSISQFLTTRPRFDWKRMFFSFVMWWLFSTLLFVIDYSTAEEGSYQLTFNAVRFFIQALLSIVFIGLQATFEEVVFRGYLLQAFGVLFRRRCWAWVLSAVLFGLLHYSNPEVSEAGNIMLLDYISVGLLLGLVVLMDGGLELVIGFHISNNLFASSIVSAEWSALQTDTVFWDTRPIGGTDVFIPSLLLLLLVVVFWKKYRWKSWKSLLFGKISE